MKKERKSISIDKGVYNLVREKQQELINKNNGDYVEIGYVAELAICAGIDMAVLSEPKTTGFMYVERGLGKSKEVTCQNINRNGMK